MKRIFLVDGDNNIGVGLQGLDLLTPDDTVLLFYGKGQTLAGLRRACANTQAHIQYLESVRDGKNSIDFQIVTELGVLVGRGQADLAYIISQDKGYEAAMSVLRSRYAGTFREVALRPSIKSCVPATFLLRCTSPEELSSALLKEYGPVQGAMAYEHLTKLFRSGRRSQPVRSKAQGQAPGQAASPASKEGDASIPGAVSGSGAESPAKKAPSQKPVSPGERALPSEKEAASSPSQGQAPAKEGAGKKASGSRRSGKATEKDPKSPLELPEEAASPAPKKSSPSGKKAPGAEGGASAAKSSKGKKGGSAGKASASKKVPAKEKAAPKESLPSKESSMPS